MNHIHIIGVTLSEPLFLNVRFTQAARSSPISSKNKRESTSYEKFVMKA